MTVNDVSTPSSILKQQWAGMVFLVVVILGVLQLLLQVISWMGDEQQLPLSQIVVQGDLVYLTVDDVKNAVNQIEPLQSFMVQDVNTIQRAILNLPWVAHVAVRKQWPDMIKVHITEYHPKAIWNATQLLDNKGTVFNGNPEQVIDLDLVSLHGPDGSEQEVLDTWQEMSKLLKSSGLDIAALSLNERRSWRIITRNGIRIELGRESRNERLQRFISLFEEIDVLDRDLQYADLRYDIGAAVGWKTASVPIEE